MKVWGRRGKGPEMHRYDGSDGWVEWRNLNSEGQSSAFALSEGVVVLVIGT